MAFKSARQSFPDGRKAIFSYDSGYEHSVEHLEAVRRLVAEADSPDANDYPSPADASEKVSSQSVEEPAVRSRRRTA
jgi:hypothetical protein